MRKKKSMANRGYKTGALRGEPMSDVRVGVCVLCSV